MASRPAHLLRLQALADAGRLRLAGPLLVDGSPVGSLIVAEFPSHADAEAFVASDPYTAAGVWTQVRVQAFQPVLP